MATRLVRLVAKEHPGSQIADPLLTLLQRYEAQIASFDDPRSGDRSDHAWDSIAHSTWVRTRDEIVETHPPITTAAGALSALNHVLQNEEVLAERDECCEQQMLWLLIKAVRDYIARGHHA
jgi:hypothetical protein